MSKCSHTMARGTEQRPRAQTTHGNGGRGELKDTEKQDLLIYYPRDSQREMVQSSSGKLENEEISGREAEFRSRMRLADQESQVGFAILSSYTP